MNDSTRKAVLQSLQIVAGIALVFSLVVGILLVINYDRMKASDPIERDLIDALVLRLQDDPQNESLKEDIRRLDLLTRKAYFSAQWQMESGSKLFIGGVVVFLFSVFLINRLGGRQRAPDACGRRASEDRWTHQLQQHWFLASGAALLFVLGIMGILLPQMKEFPVSADHAEGKIEDIESDQLQPIAKAEPDTMWPFFRGMGSNSVAVVESAPTRWDFESGEGIKWHIKVPKPGFNSPVVWGDKLFVSGADENGQEIYCFNRNDGSVLWTHTVGPIAGSEFVEDPYYETGRAASTLAVDGRYVCAIFANGNLICTDFKGNKVWATTLGIPENHYGHSSSLIIHEGLVFVQWDQAENPRLLAYSLVDGSIAWQVERFELSWSSPICVDTGGQYELILTDSESVSSYNPGTGEMNWRAGDVSGGEMGPSAFFHNGVVYAGTDIAQFVAIKLQDGVEPEVLWEFCEHLPDTASMVGVDDYVFMATGYGVLACVDTHSGEMLWEFEADDGFYGSPILVGNLIYVWDLEGNAYLFEATGEFKLHAKIPTEERVATTPAFVGNDIILRTEENLYCIEGKSDEEGV